MNPIQTTMMKEEALSCFFAMHVRAKNPFGSRGRLFTFNVATESTCSWGVWERWGDTDRGNWFSSLLRFRSFVLYVWHVQRQLQFVLAVWKVSPWSLKDMPHGHVHVLSFHWWLMRWGLAPGCFFLKQQWGYAQQTQSNSTIQCGAIMGIVGYWLYLTMRPYMIFQC